MNNPVIIKNWYIEKRHYGDVLVGNFYNDPRFIDGHEICTSPIKEVIVGEDFITVITKNSTYILDPDLEYKGD